MFETEKIERKAQPSTLTEYSAIEFAGSAFFGDLLRSHSASAFFSDLLSSHPEITPAIVKANRQIEWDYRALSKNINITIDDVLQNSDIPWDNLGLSSNANFDAADIIANPQVKWYYHWIIEYNPNLKLDDILKYNLLKSESNDTIYALLNNKYTKDPNYIKIANLVIADLKKYI